MSRSNLITSFRAINNDCLPKWVQNRYPTETINTVEMGMTWAVIVVVLAFLYYQFVPNVLEPTLWQNPPPLLNFDGKLAVNQILANAVRAEGHYHGPESIAFDSELGTGYVSFGDGVVRSFTVEGTELGAVFFSGGFVNGSTRGDGLDSRHTSLRNWCNTESDANRLAWDTVGETVCGRPLGLRFREEDGTKYLYIVDAYHGIFKLNLLTHSAVALATPDTPIVSHPQADSVAQKTPLFFNDLDIALDGKVVFTDSSYRHTRSNNRPEILDGAPRGRLFQYDPVTQQVSLLLCGLHFPNGVQFLSPKVEYHTEMMHSAGTLSEDGGKGAGTTVEHIVEKVVQQEVLVNELTRFRVLKVNTDRAIDNAALLTSSCSEEGGLYQALAPNAHTESENYAITGVTTFIANIPGLVDNVRRDIKKSKDNKEYYLFGLGSKSVAPFSLLYTALQSNLLREIIGRVIPMRLVEKLVPRYGLIVVANEEGELVNAVHDPTGTISMLSQASRHPLSGDLWLGSHSEPLAILPARFVPESWE